MKTTNNNTVVVINGHPTSGKDTFVKLCSKNDKSVKNISIVDYPKSIAELCGWRGSKLDKDRKFLADLLDILAEWDDIPFKKVCEFIEQCNNNIIFIHSRSPYDIERFKNKFNATTIFIDNKNVKRVSNNHADNNVEDYNYDYIIDNNKGIVELNEGAKTFLKLIKEN